MSKTVEIRLAFAWDCPNCGCENFCHAVLREFTPAEQDEAEEVIGERPETGNWVSHPETVVCKVCQMEFRAVNPGENASDSH